MKPVEIYTTPICGFCHRAKQLLNQKGVDFVEFDVMSNPERKAEMIQRANGSRTVPQIFVGNDHVGGCDDLYALERQGKLDALLAA
ncbi:glutaredoxin 3 [Pseudosulfitobacter pseudonitzschiae]|uniref:Glutaredoxin n=1 Tax=Pseudosulfitobacter pseudonitzschiae TaxID=1402135 RepID=A0A073J5A9_9RHOB|nr:glutaredoxin 3 [Pseudosulfitobacter pseudonitzschiae]KEJ96975.1 glutaredoxin [Pseudosulfitobacter pseudonitzschiae]MBM1815529.1 glutaredoxin 3 [Pseudosulfitobacter pseudonitzschiae]MBM1832520.1 glutaredoxin 3 [Pseudosulfitobacter pseudonitzschiae]MBM1837388.1 glutaredoxin 3 [Pseudosulfitobacter pseudonitzschiae]MBM1842234.1 glutaredoxin 3 [Pseudosulfitobacter pseudonitzschiae]